MKNRNLIYFVFSLIVLSVSVGCTRQHRQTKLTRAYALVNANPDSVLHQLQAINYRQLPQDEKAYYALLYTMAQDKSGLDVDQDTLLHYAHDYYSTRLQDTMYAKCMYYVGLYYLHNDSNKLAEDCFQNAIRSAEQNKDYYTQYLALNRLSHSLKSSNFELALQAAKNAYSVYNSYCNPNVYNRVYLIIGIGNVFDLLNRPDSALYYMRSAYNLSSQTKDNKLLSASYQSLSVAFRNTIYKDSALYYAKKALEFAPFQTESLLLNIAECYINLDSLSQSIKFLEKTSLSSRTKMKYRSFCLLRDAYFKRGDLKQSQVYADSAIEAYKLNYQQIADERSGFFLDNMKLQSEKERMDRDSKFYFAIIVLCLVILLILAYSFWYYQREKRKNEDRLSEVIRISEQEKEKHDLENRDKQVQLMRKYLYTKFSLDKPDKENAKFSNITISDDDWIDMELFINSTDNMFVKRIQDEFPELSEEDLHFFMLLRLDFSLNTLSRVYGIGQNSIKQKQNRYKQKINITDSNVSLRAFLKAY